MASTVVAYDSDGLADVVYGPFESPDAADFWGQKHLGASGIRWDRVNLVPLLPRDHYALHLEMEG